MRRLAELRISRRLTMREVAKDLKITSSTLSNYENDKRKPDVDMLNKLADYFDVSADYLLGRTDQKHTVARYFTPAITAPGYDKLTPDDRLKVQGYIRALLDEEQRRYQEEIDKT